MPEREPIAELDEQYSEPNATPTSWGRVRQMLDAAGVYWVSTVRQDGRPHVTPVAAVWFDGAMYFPSGPNEQKAKNLARNAHSVLTTGSNDFDKGLDIVIDGNATPVIDESTLTVLASMFARSYGNFFGFEVRDGEFVHGDGTRACVYRVVPAKAFAYGRGPYTATRFRF